MIRCRRWLGSVIIEKAVPSIAFDLKQLPAKLRKEGTIDDLAWELERIGAGNADSIRTSALHAYANTARSYGADCIGFLQVDSMLDQLAYESPFLGTYLVCVAARAALDRTPTPWPRMNARLDMLFQWLNGAVPDRKKLKNEESDLWNEMSSFQTNNKMNINSFRVLRCAMQAVSAYRTTRETRTSRNDLLLAMQSMIRNYCSRTLEMFEVPAEARRVQDVEAEELRDLLLDSFVDLPRHFKLVTP